MSWRSLTKPIIDASLRINRLPWISHSKTKSSIVCKHFFLSTSPRRLFSRWTTFNTRKEPSPFLSQNHPPYSWSAIFEPFRDRKLYAEYFWVVVIFCVAAEVAVVTLFFQDKWFRKKEEEAKNSRTSEEKEADYRLLCAVGGLYFVNPYATFTSSYWDILMRGCVSRDDAVRNPCLKMLAALIRTGDFNSRIASIPFVQIADVAKNRYNEKSRSAFIEFMNEAATRREIVPELIKADVIPIIVDALESKNPLNGVVLLWLLSQNEQTRMHLLNHPQIIAAVGREGREEIIQYYNDLIREAEISGSKEPSRVVLKTADRDLMYNIKSGLFVGTTAAIWSSLRWYFLLKENGYSKRDIARTLAKRAPFGGLVTCCVYWYLQAVVEVTRYLDRKFIYCDPTSSTSLVASLIRGPTYIPALIFWVFLLDRAVPFTFAPFVLAAFVFNKVQIEFDPSRTRPQ
eukprot:TRINITY_DN7134_c0_g1_i1.p1 TRINITY_DN7134_c0_g1~~TRINITY_DN7134_c0_g1_i1.p1  ORF type:complete len:457 (+),score=41.48 TRINITY_DN7134_c0_g1_i1:194-1564(+)